jgi:tetratricopeptide (TPR) repeat protein
VKNAARADVTSKPSSTARRLALGVVVLAALPYLNALRNGFTYDDLPLVAENPRIRSLAGIGRALTTDWWDGKRPQSLLYRPLTMASFGIDYAASRWGETGPPPARLADRAALPFHLQNLAWHVAASATLFFLVLSLFTSPWLAFATAALFSVHPVHTEAMNGIVGRAELMSAAFGLAALLAARRSRLTPAAVLLFLALLSKEQAIVIPLIPLLFLTGKSLRRVLAAFAVPVVVYLALRAAVLGSPAGGASALTPAINVDNPIASATGAARVWTPFRVFGHAVGLLAWPRTLRADYSYDQIPLVGSPDLPTALGILVFCGLAAGAVTLRAQAAPAAFGLSFFLLSWLVTSNLPIVIGTIFGERLLYLSSAGACLAIAAGLRAIPARGLGTAAAAVWVLAGGARAYARNRDWKDNLTLFARTAADSPRSCKALDGYASELLAAGRPQDAIPWAEHALAVYPLYPNAHLTLAKSLRLMAHDEANPGRRAELLRRAEAEVSRLTDADASADVWNVRGALALDAGNAGEARAHFEKSLASDAAYVPARVGLGVVEMGEGHADAALKRFEQAAALDPGNGDARQNAAAALRELAARAGDPASRAELLRRAEAEESRAIALGAASADPATLANLHGLRGRWFLEERRFPEALLEFREAARLEPQAARAFLGIGTVLASQAETEVDQARRSALLDEAIGAFEHAVVVAPDDPTAHMNLGITYLRQRPDPAKVVLHFRAYLRLVPDSPQRAQMEETIRQMEQLQKPAAPQVP